MLLPFPVVGIAISADPRSAEIADGASALTRLVCGILLGGRAFVYEAAAGVLEVRTNEPLELLQLCRLADQHVFCDRIDLADVVDCSAAVGDDPGVDEVERSQMGASVVAADGVVVPSPIALDRSRCALGELPSAAIRSATSSA
ncbi:hypothetical protein G9444_1413 [Rhodococcus erythropolis]|uniref:Uncharacterized protein n=1 Tax=Rhodococcus erythropolis TaxID=1833 RepID=A0A6G9CPL8_RHOER|nr:hypothetical protein G9444_1413 [Rhodococcus erythropolis]